MTRLLIALIALSCAAPAVAQDAPPDPAEDVEAAAGADGDAAVDDEAPAPDDNKPPADEPAAADDDADDSKAVAEEPVPADGADDSKAVADEPVPADGAQPVEDDGDADDGDADDGDADDGDAGDGDDADAEAVDKPQADPNASSDPLSAFRAGEYAKARDAWLSSLPDRPGAPALHYRIAVSAALAEDHAVAETHAATVERLDPGNLKAIELAAAARVARTRAAPIKRVVAQAEQALRDGRLRSANRLATAALSEEGADVGALHRIRGEALLALGRADEAASALESAAASGHTDPRLWLALGDAAKLVGDKARATYLYALASQGAAPADPVVGAAEARRKALGKTSRRTRRR